VRKLSFDEISRSFTGRRAKMPLMQLVTSSISI